MNQAVVYKITSPCGKVYIGSTKDYKKRLKRYNSLDCKGQTKLYRSLSKYGVNAHSFIIIQECSIGTLLELERFWGLTFDVLGANGLNLQLPNLGSDYITTSQETRTNISKSLKGRIFTKDWKQKLSDKAKLRTGEKNAAFGNKRPDFAIMAKNRDKTGILNPMFGKNHSQVSRQKISSTKTGLPNVAKCKIVLCTCSGIFFDNVKEAAQAKNIKYSTLVSMLNGRNNNKTSLIYG